MMTRSFLTVAAVALTVLALGGCGSSARGPYNSTAEEKRDPQAAEKRYREAMTGIDKDPAEAEQGLRAALGLDLYHGPAHNNLGVLLLKKGRLYDAAEEFEWARKLMPGNPEPRSNLAIALDRGGKTAEALDAARTALEVAPGNLAAIQALALIQVRERIIDEHTAEYLDAIVMRGDERWREWARGQRAVLAEH